ncbi:hypothetical protein POM88_044094 [Heracleum sosnowskyi]|uniref:Uncharacterized protein n=1 Tax=Heracleum sosnowskyi TaxID=360622 RepID=A0AAD8H4R0_9APIA|nr:hypothetical protein POM88_044094 [Heracleum sosnowskyi]
MSDSAPTMSLPSQYCVGNSKKPADEINHPPASVPTHTRTIGDIHHPPEIRTHAPTFVASNGQESDNRFVKGTTTGSPMPGFAKAAQPYHNDYPRQTSISQPPAQYPCTPARRSVPLAPPAFCSNNAEAKPDPVNRPDYVVIDVRDFGNDMNHDLLPTDMNHDLQPTNMNHDLQPTWRSKLTLKGAMDLFHG